MNMVEIESKTMNAIFLAYLIMAFAGISAFSFSNSEAVLIDGVFNFISALSMIAGIKIARLVSKKPTRSQPFGLAMYETLYTLFKGIMIFSVVIIAAISNTMKIYHYIANGYAELVSGGPILIYSIAMVVICSMVYCYLAVQIKRVNNLSVMLQTEKIAVLQNALISGAIGIVFFSIQFLENSSLKVLIPITDAIVVLALCLILIGDPVKIIKNAFDELIIRDTHHNLREELSDMTGKLLPEGYKLSQLIINRLGRTYYFSFFIRPLKESLPVKEMNSIDDQLRETVKQNQPFSFVDIIFTNQTISKV